MLNTRAFIDQYSQVKSVTVDIWHRCRLVLGNTLLTAALFLIVSSTQAGSIDPVSFNDPELEQRYQYLIQNVRCPTCQNQSISDSNAMIAEDLRKVIIKKLKAGESNEQIILFLRERYGDFIYYQPSVTGVNLLIWLAPAFLLIIGIVWMVLRIKNSHSAKVDEQELKRLEQELRNND